MGYEEAGLLLPSLTFSLPASCWPPSSEIHYCTWQQLQGAECLCRLFEVGYIITGGAVVTSGGVFFFFFDVPRHQQHWKRSFMYHRRAAAVWTSLRDATVVWSWVLPFVDHFCSLVCRYFEVLCKSKGGCWESCDLISPQDNICTLTEASQCLFFTLRSMSAQRNVHWLASWVSLFPFVWDYFGV